MAFAFLISAFLSYKNENYHRISEEKCSIIEQKLTAKKRLHS